MLQRPHQPGQPCSGSPTTTAPGVALVHSAGSDGRRSGGQNRLGPLLHPTHLQARPSWQQAGCLVIVEVFIPPSRFWYTNFEQREHVLEWNLRKEQDVADTNSQRSNTISDRDPTGPRPQARLDPIVTASQRISYEVSSTPRPSSFSSRQPARRRNFRHPGRFDRGTQRNCHTPIPLPFVDACSTA